MTQKPPPAQPVVHIVDDDESLRVAIARLLRAAGYEVCCHASAGEFALADLTGTRGCLILDVRMPGPSGLDLQAALARREDALPIIFLTGHGDVPMSVRAMKAGAVDFLTKPVERDELLATVKAALARDAAMDDARAKLRGWRARFVSLTPRQREVFEQVVTGKPNKQIAEQLGTAEGTVKAHRAQVMDKMGVQSLAELVHIASRLREPR